MSQEAYDDGDDDDDDDDDGKLIYFFEGETMALWFSCDFPIVFSMVFLWFSYGFQIVVLFFVFFMIFL